jgi:uncharacterized protein (TIGR02147 family)
MLFDYLDYRQFLKDYLAKMQQQSRYYSLRATASRAGVDPSYLSKVLRGEKNLTPQAGVRIAHHCKFSRKETAYFELLIQFNQAKGAEEKSFYMERLSELQQRRNPVSLNANHAAYYTAWYITVVRELLNCSVGVVDEKDIAAMVSPSITAAEARRALEVLQRLELVEKNEDGSWRVRQQFITAGPAVATEAVREFQRQMLRQAADALDGIAPELREIATLTLSLSEAGFAQVRDHLRELRSTLMAVADNDKNPQGVYQINFQAFPVARVAKGGTQ